MKKLYDIKKDLYNYVKRYNDLLNIKEDLVTNVAIYEDLLRILNDCISFEYSEIYLLNLCLNTLFGNKYDDLQDNIFMCARLNKIKNIDREEIDKLIMQIVSKTNEIKVEYINTKTKLDDVVESLEKEKDKMISARKIQTCLKYKQIISKEDVVNLNIILRELGYNNDDIAEIVENVFVRNKSLLTKKTGFYFNANEKYKFLDLFSFGGEIFELPHVEESGKLKKFADSIYSVFENYSADDIEEHYTEFLPEIGKEIKDINELEFILINVLQMIKDSFDEKVALIKDPDFIMDLEIKNELASDCYKLISYYNLIRNYMDKMLEKTTEVVENDVLSNDLQVDDNNSRIFYLVNNFDKCYLLSDIKDMPKEYISKVKELMDNFKTEVIANKQNKMLHYGSEFSELKGDQIRIIYKRLENNNYLFYGAFIKKDDWKYRVDFKRVIGRVGKICDDSSLTESEIDEYIIENQRKWSR